jgi:hypothetical protein
VIESFTRATSCHGATCASVRAGDGRYGSIEETARGTLVRELIIAEPSLRSGVDVAILGTSTRFDRAPSPTRLCSASSRAIRAPASMTATAISWVPGAA